MERNEGETRLFHYLLLSSDGSWFGEGRTAVSKGEQHQGGETLIPALLQTSPVTLPIHLIVFPPWISHLRELNYIIFNILSSSKIPRFHQVSTVEGKIIEGNEWLVWLFLF